MDNIRELIHKEEEVGRISDLDVTENSFRRRRGNKCTVDRQNWARLHRPYRGGF